MLKNNNIAFCTLLFLQLLTYHSFGQEYNLKVKVTDKKTGEPIYYALVSIANKETITATDFDGNYAIKVSIKDTIIVRHIGMITQKHIVNTDSINIELEEIDALIEVYGPEKSTIKQIDHSITTVERKKFNKKK